MRQVCAAKTAVGLVDQRHPAGVLVAHQLLVGQLRVVEEVVVVRALPGGVQEQVLVDQGEPELVRRDGSCYGDDLSQGFLLRPAV